MGIERKFVQDGLTKARINEYFTKQLERAGYGGMVINRTPMGTQITLFAEKPGMVIGKGGSHLYGGLTPVFLRRLLQQELHIGLRQ